MQVLFDLRPPHLVALQSQRVDIARVLSLLLFLLFIISSIYNIGFTALNYFRVRTELTAATGEQMSVRDQLAGIVANVKRMQALKTRVVAYLEFTREELPAVEFMRALEDAVPQGLKISSLEVRPGSVLMIGSAVTDAEIISFAAKMDAMKYIVTKVDSPVTTKSVLGSRPVSDFQVSCSIRKMLDIAADDPSQQTASPIPAEGGN
ncbi:MAG: hypothetical protein LBR87_04545 [Synergistaceae bacterium]|jgi:hypothetical protein|nr:hypothetical protein [Synergistaceae bacterium]